MGKTHAAVIAVLGLLLALTWFVTSRAVDPDRRGAEIRTGARAGDAADPAAGTGLVGGPVAPASRDTQAPDAAIVRDDVVYTPEDLRIFRETMAWARDHDIAALPIGDIIARTGRRFVGQPYTPHTLDLPGPERVVVNLRELDCVTFVESTLALARVIRSGPADATFDDFVRELRTLRYREGTLDGYTSRLHYFSEWIADNDELGLVRNVTAELGGRTTDEAIDFMSTHADAYSPLDGHPDRVARIREIEARLSRTPRHWIPQERIGDVADRIRDGDVIAATSSVDGLDIAHTGFALWQGGRLHLMHAPLVGRELEISADPLAVRILKIDGQDGIMVARPL